MSAQQVNVNGHTGMGHDSASGGGTAGVDILARIHEALVLIHNPYSANQDRQQAQQFLEQVKNHGDAPSHGYNLAVDKSQDPVIRHFALSLLEHAIKHKWADYTAEQAAALRQCVLQLAQGISREDPPYLRIKIAVIWVEVAKRSWVDTWMDMDMLLLQLWQVPDSPVHKELVLQILETLSDEVFNGDDAVVSAREGELSKACVDIFTPQVVLTKDFPRRDAGPAVRCDEDGWLKRITDFLGQCLSGDVQNSEDLRNCAVRALNVLYSLMPWIIPNAVVTTGCVPVMCEALRASSVSVQKAAMEALHALYGRNSFADAEFANLVVPLYDHKYIELFGQLFQWSTVDVEDIDEDKYQFAKKLSETVSFLGNYMERRFSNIPADNERVDFPGFLRLLLMITQSQSMVVSIPVLVTWTRLLGHRSMGDTISRLPEFIGPLLEVCSSRQIRYENLPEDTQDPTFLFLHEDTDNIPERHAFLGNYRRLSSHVIEAIVQINISGAIPHILGQTENTLQHLYDSQAAFSPTNYNKHSPSVLSVDKHATVVEAALKGVSKWRRARLAIADTQDEGVCKQIEQEVKSLENVLEEWANRLLAMKLEISKRVLQVLVALSTTVLDKSPGFMLKVLEHILMTWPGAQPEHREYTEAIKDLQSESTIELHRLAAKMPDHLLDVYEQIAARVNEMSAAGTLDDKRQITYKTFLFSIIPERLDLPTRAAKLMEFITPIQNQWQDSGLRGALSSYEGFCGLLVLDKAQNYLARRRVHEIKDWGSVALDAEGQALQAELEERQAALPLRPTKAFLSSSVEKIERNTDAYAYSREIWQNSLPLILPELLKFLSYAHSCHIASNWTGLPPEMRSIVERVLTDRFWQAGISEGSKDDFYARVVDKKHTVEGLASTIRGTIRFVRDSCYSIIYCMSRLGEQFYGFGELPGPLAHAVFADCLSLSAHQMTSLLNLSRYLVDNCPVQLREHFCPPVLAACFRQMDAKISSEWDKLAQQQDIQSGREALTEEMKAESVLRQLTHAAVMMVADFLDPNRISKHPRPRHIFRHARPSDAKLDPDTSEKDDRKYPLLRKFCLMNSSIAEPLLVFATHAIRMRDTRCCSVIVRVFRSIVPDFRRVEPTAPQSLENLDAEKRNEDTTPISEATASVIREYISTNVLQACITSIHEPYFVDLQKELAFLIGSIILHYCPITSTPRDVLLSLPNMQQAEVDKAIDRILRPPPNPRYHRTIVLELLKDLKGVSISEMGRLSKSLNLSSNSRKSHNKGKTRTLLTQGFMATPSAAEGTNGPKANGESDVLDGVASMFKQ